MNAHTIQYNGSRSKAVHILDSTLREGEQHPGVSFTAKQRAQIAWELDCFGVDQIEIAPGVSPDHRKSLKTILSMGLRADIVSHGRAMPSDIDISANCGAKWCAAYLGISDIHMRDKLRITRQEAMKRAVSSVDHAKKLGLKMRFTIEDGSRADPEFAKSVCRELAAAGVDRISLPDTVGAMLPGGMAAFVSMIRKEVDVQLDVHTHNDMGLALANSLAGVDAGADQIHTTINGIGERTGIPSLAETATVLSMLYKTESQYRLDLLCDLSRHLTVYTGLQTAEDKPLVGMSAYKHKAGTHLAAVLRAPEAYEIVPPQTVGNSRRVVFGGLAGKTGAAHLLNMLGIEADDETAKGVARALKSMGRGDIMEMPLEDTKGVRMPLIDMNGTETSLAGKKEILMSLEALKGDSVSSIDTKRIDAWVESLKKVEAVWTGKKEIPMPLEALKGAKISSIDKKGTEALLEFLKESEMLLVTQEVAKMPLEEKKKLRH